MARTVDIPGLKTRSISELESAGNRYSRAAAGSLDPALVRWVAKMTAVELHAVWERYVEGRLVAALNHNPSYFLADNTIKGVKRVSSGLAYYVIRGGGRYFDFRSMSDLLDKGNRWLGKEKNPFRQIAKGERAYIDTLSAIRNCVVHRSEASNITYKRSIKKVYGIVSAPEPDEFLNAKDPRDNSPAQKQSRLQGLVVILTKAIRET